MTTMAARSPYVAANQIPGQVPLGTYLSAPTPTRTVCSVAHPCPTNASTAPVIAASQSSQIAPISLHPGAVPAVATGAGPGVAPGPAPPRPVRMIVGAQGSAMPPGQLLPQAAASSTGATASQSAPARIVVMQPQQVMVEQQQQQQQQQQQPQATQVQVMPSVVLAQPPGAAPIPFAGTVLQTQPQLQGQAQSRIQTQTAPQVVAQSHSLQLALSRISRENANPDQRLKAYRSLLMLLEKKGFFESLPLDSEGVLGVAGPFCHDFFEAPELLPFLAKKQQLEGEVAARGPCTKISAFGADLHPQQTWWSAWEAWAKHAYPEGSITLQLKAQDLAQVPLPKSGLVMGLHPEVTNGGPWPAILKNALDCRLPGGRLVFATFYQHEANETKRVCEGFGEVCEVVENPFYIGEPPNSVGTFLRFAVIVAPRAD